LEEVNFPKKGGLLKEKENGSVKTLANQSPTMGTLGEPGRKSFWGTPQEPIPSLWKGGFPNKYQIRINGFCW